MRGLLAVLLGALALPGPAGAATLVYDGGVGVASGRYFFDRWTTTWTITTGLLARSGRVDLRVALPLVMQNGPLVAGSGAGLLPTGGAMSGAVSDSGRAGRNRSPSRMRVPVGSAIEAEPKVHVGDPLGRVTVRIRDDADATAAISALAKAPVADATSYGTGAWDLGASLLLERRFDWSWFAALDLSAWRLGDLPDLDFRNPVLVSVSAGRVAGDWEVGVTGSAGTSSLRGYEAPITAGVILSRRAGRTIWGLYGSAGLSETVPDAMLGVNWRIPLEGDGS